MVSSLFLPYRDRYGLNQLSTKNGEGEVTQNGTLFTMQYLICLVQNNDPALHPEIDRIKKVFESCEPIEGLSQRTPDSKEIDSMDNQAALLAFSALYDEGRYAKRMLGYGESIRIDGIDQTSKPEQTLTFYPIAWILNGFRKPRYVWNCEHPQKFNISAWWGRSPGLLGLAKMAAGRFCNPFLWLSVLVGQFVSAFKPIQDTDGRTLPFVTWQYLKTRSCFWNLAYKLWLFILNQRYPNGMQDVYGIYYQDKSHPIIRYTKRET